MKWKDPSLTLGERCVAFAEQELANGVKEDHPGSYTSARIREYFAICTRVIGGKEVNINFTTGNWCAASASYALHESLLPGETHPHGYRLGVVEVVSDLQHNGLYHTIAEAKSGAYQLKVGDPVIFDRSRPNDPATAWFRHIGRVYSVDGHGGFQCISGNSGGKYSISAHQLSQTNILGFGEYSGVSMTQQQAGGLPDWSHVNILDLAPMEDTGHNLAIDHITSLFNALG